MLAGMVFDLGPNEEGMCCSVAEDASIIAAGLRSGGVMVGVTNVLNRMLP